jgi:hypothetical protein
MKFNLSLAVLEDGQLKVKHAGLVIKNWICMTANFTLILLFEILYYMPTGFHSLQSVSVHFVNSWNAYKYYMYVLVYDYRGKYQNKMEIMCILKKYFLILLRCTWHHQTIHTVWVNKSWGLMRLHDFTTGYQNSYNSSNVFNKVFYILEH